MMPMGQVRSQVPQPVQRVGVHQGQAVRTDAQRAEGADLDAGAQPDAAHRALLGPAGQEHRRPAVQPRRS